MWAIKNKKTGRLLRLEAERVEYSDWGYDGHDEKLMDYQKIIFNLSDSEYGMFYVSGDEYVVDKLIQDGKYEYSEETYINFGWGDTQFSVADLEKVQVGELSNA